MEIDRDIVPKFVDPVFWLHYFPPIAKHDLIEMGVKVDWRRSLSPPLQNTYMHTHRPALAHRVSRPRGKGQKASVICHAVVCLPSAPCSSSCLAPVLTPDHRRVLNLPLACGHGGAGKRGEREAEGQGVWQLQTRTKRARTHTHARTRARAHTHGPGGVDTV